MKFVSQSKRTSKSINVKTPVVFAIILILLFVTGCATNKPASTKHEPDMPAVTVPNGSSPAKANAPRAPMNDTDEMRKDWNHGNDVLWVNLPPAGIIAPDGVEKDGSLRVKFGWWRGIPGKFTITGRRLDASALPLRSLSHPESYGTIGFVPSLLYFPTEGYWEVTGQIDHQCLTFVIRVVKQADVTR